MMHDAYLVLEDGTVFPGKAFGALRESVGELVFTTGVVGYLETLTDPSYAGQIILQTFPMIGNYGVIPRDFEGAPCARGYVVNQIADHPSNFRCAGLLEDFLRDSGIPGIRGVDTRAVTRHIRARGVLNAMICRSVPAALDVLSAYQVRDVVPEVTCASPQEHLPEGPVRFRVALLDYGAHLKKTLPNPSRRSKHHSVQSKFEGSRREKRSFLLKQVFVGHAVYVETLPRAENVVLRVVVVVDHAEIVLLAVEQDGDHVGIVIAALVDELHVDEIAVNRAPRPLEVVAEHAVFPVHINLRLSP